MSASRGLPRRTPFLLIARPISSPVCVIGLCLSFWSMGPPDNAKLARMTLGKPCQASYWAPRATHPSGDSEIKVSVRVLSVNGVQSGAKRSNSGSTDSQRLLALSWLQLSGLGGGIGLLTGGL